MLGPGILPKYVSQNGAVAQLGAQFPCKEKVVGSSPIGSTMKKFFLKKIFLDFYKKIWYNIYVKLRKKINMAS